MVRRARTLEEIQVGKGLPENPNFKFGGKNPASQCNVCIENSYIGQYILPESL
jgi:hypothetical protein